MTPSGNEKGKGLSVWISPIIVLAWGLFYYFFLEKIPIFNGYGWDGRVYGNLAGNFSEIIRTTGISSYYSQRIFPSAIIFSFINIFHLSPTTDLIIRLFSFYNILLFVASSILWIKISSGVKLTLRTQWLGFILLFITFPVLKFYPYYPVLTDPTAYFLGFLTVYAAVRNRSLLMLLVICVSYFTWPQLAGMSIIFFLFPLHQQDSVNQGTVTTGKYLGILAILIISILILWVIISSRLTENKSFAWYMNLILSFASVILFLSFTMIALIKKFSLHAFLNEIIAKKLLIRFSILILLFVAMGFLKSSITNTSLYGPDLKSFTIIFIRTSIQLPFKFIIAHVTFFGPSVLLCIIFYKEIYRKILCLGYGGIFASLLCLFFSIGSESRWLIGYYPFLILLLSLAVNTREMIFSKMFIPGILVFSLLFSKIWFPMNLPETWNSQPDYFPFQRYFMNQGPWMSHNMFILHSTGIILTFFIILWLLPEKRKSLLTSLRILKPVE